MGKYPEEIPEANCVNSDLAYLHGVVHRGACIISYWYQIVVSIIIYFTTIKAQSYMNIIN